MERYIFINDERIPVTEEEYRAYMRPIWRERKRRKVRREKERSLEAFADAGFDIPSGDALVDEVIEDKLLLEMLMDALDKLTTEERALIDALYYDEKTEQNMADSLSISQQAVNKKRRRILEKIKNLIDL